MKRTLLALAVALTPAATLAQPPAKGTTHTFLDPVFEGTIFCDTYFEVLAIATADDPQQVYGHFLTRRNDIDEPVCAAIAPTGVVIDVRPLGIMERDAKRYDAWAVEAKIGEVTGFGLYLEQRKDLVI
jgi:hypothetical protein